MKIAMIFAITGLLLLFLAPVNAGGYQGPGYLSNSVKEAQRQCFTHSFSTTFSNVSFEVKFLPLDSPLAWTYNKMNSTPEQLGINYEMPLSMELAPSKFLKGYYSGSYQYCITANTPREYRGMLLIKPTKNPSSTGVSQVVQFGVWLKLNVLPK